MVSNNVYEELKFVHQDRHNHIARYINGQWVWGKLHTSSSRPATLPATQSAFTSSDSQNQPPTLPPSSTNNQIISGDLTTESNNIADPSNIENSGLRNRSNSLASSSSSSSSSTSSSTMDEKHGRSGHRKTASMSGPMRPNAPRPLSFLDSIDTISTPPTPVSSFVQADPPAERVRDGPYMYAGSPGGLPGTTSDGGSTSKSAQSISDGKSTGDKSASLTTKADEAGPTQNPSYAKSHVELQLDTEETQKLAKEIQPHAQKTSQHLENRLNKGQSHINTTKQTLNAKQTSAANPDFQLPQKPRTSAASTSTAKSNHQLPQKPQRQTYKPLTIDTLPEDDIPAFRFNTPPAVKAYRERYLPSIIGTGSPSSKKSKTTPLELSTPTMGSVLSTSSPKRLFSTKEASADSSVEEKGDGAFAPEPSTYTGPKDVSSFQTPGAVPYNLTPSPVGSPEEKVESVFSPETSSDTGPRDVSLFQTPGAVPYNFTPSPVGTPQESDYYEHNGGRSSSPSDNGFDMAGSNSPPVSVNEAASVQANETAPILETKAASPIPRPHSPDARAPTVEEVQDTVDLSQASNTTNPADLPAISVQRPGAPAPAAADGDMQDIIDLTDSPSPPPAPSNQLNPRHPIDLTSSLTPTPELEDFKRASSEADKSSSLGSEDLESIRASRAAFEANFAQGHRFQNTDEPAHTSARRLVSFALSERVPAQEHHTQNLNDRASISGSRSGSLLNETVSAQNTDSPVNSAQPFHFQDLFEVAKPPGASDPAEDFLQDEAGRKEESPIPSSSFVEVGTVVDAVAPVEVNKSSELPSEGDAMDIDEIVEGAASSGENALDIDETVEVDVPLKGSASAEDHAMDIDETVEVDAPFEVSASAEDHDMDIDEQLSSDLSEVPSDSELTAIKEQTEKLLKAKKAAQVPSDSEPTMTKEQAVKLLKVRKVVETELNRLTASNFPRAALIHFDTSKIQISEEQVSELQKEGDIFTLANTFFTVVPKAVFDQIWLDENDSPQISLFTGPPKWVRPLDPKSRPTVKADPSSIELIKVVCEIEKLLITMWASVESIVVICYTDPFDEVTSTDLQILFRKYQLEIFYGFKSLHPHLLTLADWKERYFASDNIKKRALRHDANPYARLFNIKNPAGVLFYGTKNYLFAMKLAIAAAQIANECATMKGPRWKALIGMHKRALGEEFTNCLPGLREFNKVTRRRDWNVKALRDVESSPSPTIGPELPTSAASTEESSKGKGKGKNVAVETASTEESPKGKGKGKSVVVEDSIEEKSDDVSDGDPPGYGEEDNDDVSDGDPPDHLEENDDEDDADYVEGRSRRRLRRRGPQLFVKPPTPRKKRGLDSISRASSGSTSMTRSASRRLSSKNEMKVSNGGRSSSFGNEMEFGDEMSTRGRPLRRAGSVQTPSAVKGVRKGAKRVVIEVDESSSPVPDKEYFETP